REDAAVVQQRLDRGFAFDWERNTVGQEWERDYASILAEDIWVVDAPGGRRRRLAQFRITEPSAAKGWTYVKALELSPDERRLLVNYIRIGRPDLGGFAFDSELAAVEVTSGAVTPIGSSVNWESAGCWLDGGAKIVFCRSSAAGSGAQHELQIFDCASGTTTATQMTLPDFAEFIR